MLLLPRSHCHFSAQFRLNDTVPAGISNVLTMSINLERHMSLIRIIASFFFSLSLSLFLSFSLSLFLHRFLLILILSSVTSVSNQFGTSRLPVAMIHLPSIEQCLHCLIISIKVIFQWLNNNQRVCRRFGPKPLAKCQSTLTTMN